VSADSLSVTLKPSTGLSGTASLTIHEDGKVTMLIYESPQKITEHTVDVNEVQKSKLTQKALQALDSYLLTNDFDELDRVNFSVSFLYTRDEVSKSVTTKRLNPLLKDALILLFEVVPAMKLSYVEGRFTE